MYTEMFPARVRYTGVAIGTQLGFVIAGFAPTIEAAIQGEGLTGWLPVAIFAAATALIAAFAAWTGKETRGVSLQQIDGTLLVENAQAVESAQPIGVAEPVDGAGAAR
jgi:hypothetical protein